MGKPDGAAMSSWGCLEGKVEQMSWGRCLVGAWEGDVMGC